MATIEVSMKVSGSSETSVELIRRLAVSVSLSGQAAAGTQGRPAPKVGT